MRLAKKPVYLTLSRHTEYDPQTGDLTPAGRDSVALVADHLREITAKISPRNMVLECNQTRSHLQQHSGARTAHNEERLESLLQLAQTHYIPPIDAIGSSDAPRALQAVELLHGYLSANSRLNHPEDILQIGQFPWLKEHAYPQVYDHFSIYNATTPIDYRHFSDIESWFGEANKQNLRHIALVTHFPTLRALSLAMVGKRITPTLTTQDDTEVDALEHKLHTKRYGVTVTFYARSWQEMLGHAHTIGLPFVPTQACEQPMDRAAVLRRIRDATMQMAK